MSILKSTRRQCNSRPSLGRPKRVGFTWRPPKPPTRASACPLANSNRFPPERSPGLFKRAILEDGSALSPLVTNQNVLPPRLPTQQQQQQQQQQAAQASTLTLSPATQHVRLLAKLCDCPVYLQIEPLANGSQAHSQRNQQQTLYAQRLSALADETKTNALMIECLRYKPIEQIMQPVPLDLIQFDQEGHLSIYSNKLAAFASSLELANPELGLADNVGGQTQPQADSSRPVQMSALKLSKLISALTDELLERERAEGAPRGAAGASSALRFGLELTELASAIYGPPSASMRPLFGPIIDGTIVPEEDVAISMLKTNSPFAQRDLLVGFSRPILNSVRQNHLSGEPEPTSSQLESRFQLGPDHSISERITNQMERTGLTGERAVELVNVFVRSFYKFHIQEITNSIVSHYLSNTGIRRPKLDKSPARNLNESQAGDEDSRISLQQSTLDSLLEAFQDALVSVPVLKTALIHATKQLDTLVEAFVGQQFERWLQQRLGGASSNSVLTNLPRDAFASFARTLFNHSIWPLELYSPSNQTLLQPRATYLFQLDSRFLADQVHKSIGHISAERGNMSEFTLRKIRESLAEKLTKTERGQFKFELSLACALEFDEDYQDINAGDGNEDSNRELEFETEIRRLVCSRIGQVLGSFVEAANFNKLLARKEAPGDTIDEISSSITGDMVSKFEAKCLAVLDGRPQQQQHSVQLDHHLVQLAGVDSMGSVGSNEQPEQALAADCSRDFDSIASRVLLSHFALEAQGEEMAPSSRWLVFSLLNHHMATLPHLRNHWRMGQVLDDLSADGKWSLSQRASLWSNFIPALNCSKTQPILPSPLQTGANGGGNPLAGTNSNSSFLLNLNLVSSCQLGARNALDSIETLSSSVKVQLQSRIAQWELNNRLSQQTAGAAHNHHSLRMATMSQSSANGGRSGSSNSSNEESADSQVEEQNRAAVLGPSSIQVTASQSVDKIAQPTEQPARAMANWRLKYVSLVLLACGLLITFTLVSRACVAMRQREQPTGKRKQNKRLTDSLEPQQGNSIDLVGQLGGSASSGAVVSMSAVEPPKQQHEQHVSLEDSLTECESDRLQANLAELQQQLLQPQQHQQHQDRRRPLADGASEQQLQPEPALLCHQNEGGRQSSRGGSSLEANRSNSSLSFTNNSASTGAELRPTSLRLIGTPLDEPILVPLLKAPASDHWGSSQTTGRRTSCLAHQNGHHFGGSSSGTQGHPNVSLPKKRVKISDPLVFVGHETARLRASHSSSRLRADQPLFCPVHSNHASNQSLEVAAPLDELSSQCFVGHTHWLAAQQQQQQQREGERDNNANTINKTNCDHLAQPAQVWLDPTSQPYRCLNPLVPGLHQPAADGSSYANLTLRGPTSSYQSG